MSSSTVIETIGVGKTYGTLTAIKNISFAITSGEIFGLLGPNGAGKTTTLRILITLLRPTTGSATVLGHDVVKDADRVRGLIGYVPQERAIDRFLTGREHLLLLGNLYHLSKLEAQERIQKLLKLVELEEHADRTAKTYSGGMKRKLDIACGLLPHPHILFLDEPTLGLDVQSRLRIWDYIRRLRDQGMTIVMTTNYLEEADLLCDRLAIIDGGHIQVIGSPKELKAGLGGDSLSLTINQANPDNLERFTAGLKPLPFVRETHMMGNVINVKVDSPEQSLSVVLDLAGRAGCQIETIEYHRPRLDEVFVAYTGHAMKGAYPESELE